MQNGRGKIKPQRRAAILAASAALCLCGFSASARAATGDTSNVMPLGIVALLIFGVLAGALIYSDRRRRDAAAQLRATQEREAELATRAADSHAKAKALDAGFETANAASAILLTAHSLDATPKLGELLAIPGNTPATLNGVIGAFEPEGRQSLKLSIANLRQSGRRFEQTLKLGQPGRFIRVAGRRFADGDETIDVLSFTDVTDLASVLYERGVEVQRMRAFAERPAHSGVGA